MRAKGIPNKKIRVEANKLVAQGHFNGSCLCECGGATLIAKQTRRDYQKSGELCSIAGLPMRYIKGHEPQRQKGLKSPFKKDKWVDCRGYVWVYHPDHWLSRKDGFLKEHVYLMEQSLGRKLKRIKGQPCTANDEIVHHINGIKGDNRLENLQVMTHASHVSLHRRQSLN